VCPTAPSQKPKIANLINLCLSIGIFILVLVRSAICAIVSLNVVVPNTVNISFKYPFSILLILSTIENFNFVDDINEFVNDINEFVDDINEFVDDINNEFDILILRKLSTDDIDISNNNSNT